MGEVIVAISGCDICKKASGESYCVQVMVKMSLLLAFISHPCCSLRFFFNYYLNYIGTKPIEQSTTIA